TVCWWRGLAVLCCAAVAAAVSAAPKDVVAKDRIAGGEHWRVKTPSGWVHVWRPAGYDRRTAGTRVYVHGFSVDVDAASEQHQLGRQRRRTRRNAVFIIPGAPAWSAEPVRWPSLNTLLTTVGSRLRQTWPTGPLVVVGHSGAHVTVVPWLKNPRVGHVILLDAIYGNDTVDALRIWLRTGRGRLVLVDGADTAAEAERPAPGLPGGARP